MKIFLAILAVAAGGFGGLIFVQAQSAIHEIEAFCLFLIAAVFVSAAAILEGIGDLKESLRKSMAEAKSKPQPQPRMRTHTIRPQPQEKQRLPVAAKSGI